MGPAAGNMESKEPLQEWPVEGKGHLEAGGEPERLTEGAIDRTVHVLGQLQPWCRRGDVSSRPYLTGLTVSDPRRNCRKCNYKKCTIVLAVALAVVSLFLIAATVLAVLQFTRSLDAPGPPFVPSPGPPFVPSPGPPFVPCCLEEWVGYQGKCYYFSKEEKNWDSSQHFCSSFSASLAAIDTQEEKDFMMNYAGLVEHWIGLRRESSQPWKWVNGTLFNQQLFQVRAEGDCAYLSDVFVSSSRCYSLRNWICSKVDAYAKEKEHAMEGD